MTDTHDVIPSEDAGSPEAALDAEEGTSPAEAAGVVVPMSEDTTLVRGPTSDDSGLPPADVVAVVVSEVGVLGGPERRQSMSVQPVTVDVGVVVGTSESVGGGVTVAVVSEVS